MLNVLLTDPWFLAALFVLLVGLSILLWCVAQLRHADADDAFDHPLPARPQDAMTQIAGHGTRLPRPAATPDETAVMYSVLEERFSDLNKRLAALESVPRVEATADALVSGLGRRLESLESEIVKIKTLMAESAAAGGGSADIHQMSEKVATLQRMIESLTSEPHATKPS